ncbi:E3 ubiquitin-protein ligase XBAT33-like isoform X1 [Aristolochia californica]|uniref:E3 ubiquitin-protein ligase XBAT33-like isoform X1 n=1 Tax=Aristolochia californica TaxID=171875 RepID=UPI0035DE2B05
MGNSFGCSASGERLVSAARDGDLVEARMLLEFNPCLAKYSTFGGLNSPLHFAAAKGHNEIVSLLLDNGADVNSRNYCGQTALMHACRYGHWEVVQSLMVFRSNVTRADYLSGRTALHFAAVNGHVRCIRLVVADFVPSIPYDVLISKPDGERSSTFVRQKYDQGWLPLDIAKIWGRHWLEPWLTPNSNLTLSTFPPSKYLSLPMMSVLNIAREYGLQSSTASSDDSDICAVCLERACSVSAEGCAHKLCVRCALYLCSTSNITCETVGPPGSIPCPLCRHCIISFVKLPGFPAKELKPNMPLGLCTPCMLHTCDPDPPSTVCKSEYRKNRVAAVSSELFCPVSCSPFPSVSIPSCTCNDDPCTSLGPSEVEHQDLSNSPRRSQSITGEEEHNLQGPKLEKASCSSMFWNRRSCHREHQCNSEINA